MSRQETTRPPEGTLFIVATPIGNLEDITFRAVRILREVALIACEDTRHTRKLLNHLGITTPLTSYYREKEQYKAEMLLRQLREGTDIALVSDAGTPALSDPGSVLVSLVRASGIRIVPVPGPAALTTALCIAGLGESAFFFGGFPPAKKVARRKFFKDLALLDVPVIFYESPHRIKACLSDCQAILGDRHALLFRELTKIHEQCLTGLLSRIREDLPDATKGELVLILHAPENRQEEKPEELESLLNWYRDQQEVTLKEAVGRIVVDLELPRSLVYKKALSVWKKKETSKEHADGS